MLDAAFHFLFVSAHNSSYLTMSSAKPPKPVFVQVPEEPGMRIVPFDPRFQASWFTFSCDSWRVLCFTVFFFCFFLFFFAACVGTGVLARPWRDFSSSFHIQR